MSATKIGSIADAIKTALDAAAISSRGNNLLVYTYEPRDLDSLPAVTIDGPTAFQRVEPDEAESQLGSIDWHVQFTLRLYVALDDPKDGTDDARAILGQMIAALDADRGLGGAADIDSVLASGEMGLTPEDAPRQMVVYTCDFRAWALVT